MRTMLVVLAMYSLAVFAEVQNAPLNLMPMPANIKMGAGQLGVDPSFSVAISGHKEPRLQRTVEIFLDHLRRQTGMLPLDMKVSDSSTGTLLIHADSTSKEVQELGEEESYRLEITRPGAKLNATTTLGVMRRLQTFLQLVETTAAGFAAPAVSIDDIPRIPSRGLNSAAWVVGYPDLASAPGPYAVERKWGVFDPAMDPTKEHTYHFLDEFIGEMAKLFLDQCFHIGGDEVNGKQWDANPQIQAFMRAHGMKTNQDLQAYFNKRVQEIVSKHGKTMIGWDEILRSELPKSIVIQSWRGQESLAQAAKQGYRSLLSHGYYIDLMWPASQHYAVDPMSDAAANLSPEESKRILGGEATMWAEYVSPENIDSRIWPRTAAIAERLWSPQNVRDVDSMYQRLEKVSHRLDFLGLTHNTGYAPTLRRIAGRNDTSALQVLTDVAEPVKDYIRENTAPAVPTSLTPLNRVVDAARPESDTARQFSDMVNALLSGKAKPGTEAQIRTLLSRWRDNQIELQPLAEKSFLVKEVLPLSQNLSTLGTAGLAALDYMDHGERAPDQWRSQQLALIEQAKKQQAQLLLMIAPAVQKLIEASATPGTASAAK